MFISLHYVIFTGTGVYEGPNHGKSVSESGTTHVAMSLPA